MVNIKELRLGNLVTASGEIVTIHTIDLGHFGNIISVKSCKGGVFNVEKVKAIPITPEILKKCGFKKKVDESYEVIAFDGEPSFGMQRQEIKSWVKSVSYSIGYFKCHLDAQKIVYYGGSTIVILKSLHQLQNLYFALTGEEIILSELSEK